MPYGQRLFGEVLDVSLSCLNRGDVEWRANDRSLALALFVVCSFINMLCILICLIE